MANAIKLLTRPAIFTQAQNDDKQVCLSSSDDDSAQDLTDFKNALDITQANVVSDVTNVITTPYTQVPADSYVLVNDTTAGGAVTINLLAAATAGNGKVLYVKKIGNTAIVTIDGNASETIDGATTAVLTLQYESVTLVCDGTNWHII